MINRKTPKNVSTAATKMVSFLRWSGYVISNENISKRATSIKLQYNATLFSKIRKFGSFAKYKRDLWTTSDNNAVPRNRKNKINRRRLSVLFSLYLKDT